MVHLFGLRIEYMLYIEPDIVDLIDKGLEPLYMIENGTYTFRPERIRNLLPFLRRSNYSSPL